ncbi:hypothetical protein SNE40_004787 [Patella caerulea]|uniref:Uncharacterized protein n=1 Tax=Patella caerulea TaxID=87958 RepID=A0AAN8Q5Y5_PATCE
MKIEKEIADRCKEYFSKYEDRLNNIELELSKKADLKEIKEVKEMLEINKINQAQGGDEGTMAVNEQIAEFRESESRKNNIIIFGISESKEAQAEHRKIEDAGAIRDLCNIMTADPNSVKSVIRLGKRSIDSEQKSKEETELEDSMEGDTEKKKKFNARPIKVVFADEKVKSKFMQNLRNLSTEGEKYKKN